MSSGDKVTSLKAWTTMPCDGFVVVGHRGNLADEFETVIIPITGRKYVLQLEGRFNVIQADGLKDALQIHEVKGGKIVYNWKGKP